MGEWASVEALDDELADWVPRTHAETREMVDNISNFLGEWEGVPVPLGEDMPLVLRPGHPMRGFYECTTTDVCENERVVNHWIDRKRNREVFILDQGGKRVVLAAPLSPDRSMERLSFWMQTLGGADAWELESEYKAREYLRGMLSERQWFHYDLTGSFLETSPRSRVTYVFRRLRPTIALSFRGRDGIEQVRCLAVLCLHPIGYYSNSWAGCMVPTDDVVAHLSWMRADEAGFWGKAVQHRPHEPEAGL